MLFDEKRDYLSLSLIQYNNTSLLKNRLIYEESWFTTRTRGFEKATFINFSSPRQEKEVGSCRAETTAQG